MYLYNVSIIIEENSHDKVIDWLRGNWIPRIEHDVRFLKMLNNPHEGHTYCIQMTVENDKEIEEFQQTYLLELNEYIQTEHREKAFIFDSLMQYL